MTEKKLNKKLQLNKETIATIDNMENVMGGAAAGANANANANLQMDIELDRKSIVLCNSLIADCQTKSCKTLICIPF